MDHPIDDKLVIAVASSALFDLTPSDRVFREQGEDEYRRYQDRTKNVVLNKGVAFPFIRRVLGINRAFPAEQPVEVVLLSRNDPETGLRVFNSIASHGLDIIRAAFLSGKSPHEYIPAFNVSLFLSADSGDVVRAVRAGFPAGTVLPTSASDNGDDRELRIAFDFDGVIADDEAEAIVRDSGKIERFHASEQVKADIPHQPGPLGPLFKKLSRIQGMERVRSQTSKDYLRIIRTAIVTARSAPSHERVVTTLRAWGVSPDETFFMGGIDKSRVLRVLQPHIFFDDQLNHLASAAKEIPSVHIPFGIANAVPEPEQ